MEKQRKSFFGDVSHPNKLTTFCLVVVVIMKLAPKRPMSAFLMYAQQKRRQLQRENPDVPNYDISRLLGELWRGTGAAEKRPFLEREEVERRMYKAKMEKWKNDQKLEKSMKSLSTSGSGGKMPDRRQDVASCAQEETHPRYGEERSQDVRCASANCFVLNFSSHILCLPRCAAGPSEQGTNLAPYPTRSASMHHSHQYQKIHADYETDATRACHQYNYDVGSWTPMYNQEEARIKYTYPRPREDQPQP